MSQFIDFVSTTNNDLLVGRVTANVSDGTSNRSPSLNLYKKSQNKKMTPGMSESHLMFICSFILHLMDLVCLFLFLFLVLFDRPLLALTDQFLLALFPFLLPLHPLHLLLFL